MRKTIKISKVVAFFVAISSLASADLPATPNMLSRFAPQMNCQASDVTTGELYGATTLKIDNSSDPLIEVSSTTVPQLNFKIGRRNAAGTDFAGKNYLDCDFFGLQDPASDALFYYCESPGTLSKPPTYSEIMRTPFRSSLASKKENSTSYRVCKNQVFCVDLQGCTPVVP